MITKQQLAEKYSKQTIAELESVAKTSLTNMKEAQIEMISVLYYLKTTGRFKENKRYAKSSWTTYIEEFIGMRSGTFDEHVRAIINYPEEVKKHHIGLVSKISAKCGAAKAPKVFTEINKLIEASHKEGPAIKDKIDKIINANLKYPVLTKTHNDWEGMYKREMAAHDVTRRELAEANIKVKELTEQVRKLKDSLLKLNKLKDAAQELFPMDSVGKGITSGNPCDLMM
jgi:hypothetical protein